MIDTHAHLTEGKLYNNLEKILNSAKESGVSKIICVGMNKDANEKVIEIINKHQEVYGSVGIHPNEVTKNELDLNLLAEQTKNDKIIAIGEIGIDLYRNKDTINIQKTYFIEQIKLAITLDLPVIIHSRNSADVIYEILKDYPDVKGVMHCYSEHKELVNKFVDLGFYIGVGGIITFKNAHEVRDIIKKVPLNRLLIETDSPYLAPDPYRGKPNEPAFVKHTLLKLAELTNIEPEELIKITRNNTYGLFSKMKD